MIYRRVLGLSKKLPRRLALAFLLNLLSAELSVADLTSEAYDRSLSMA